MTTAPDTRTLQVTRTFAFPPERVFDAWLDPAIAQRFLFASPTGEIVRVELDPRVGGRFVIVRRDNGVDIEHAGEYLEIDRPRRLVFTFGVPKLSAQFTTVNLDIEPAGDGCKLTLTHQGVLREWADRTQEGWGMILAGLDDTIRQPYAALIAPDTILLERLLPGPVERVWEYIADSEKRGKWFGTGVIQPKAGSIFTLYMRNSDLSTVKEPTPPQYAKYDTGHSSECTVTEYDPPRALAFLWGDSSAQQQDVRITLTPSGENVLLRLTHRRISGTGRMEDFAVGWQTHLGFLANLLHGRDPGNFWKAFAANEAAYAKGKLQEKKTATER
ncbi:MAG TPA: SRPBCC domain-containing protein [Acidobacteriaceae bacterium]